MRKGLTKNIEKQKLPGTDDFLYNVKSLTEREKRAAKGRLNSTTFQLWIGKSIGFACHSNNPCKIKGMKPILRQWSNKNENCATRN